MARSTHSQRISLACWAGEVILFLLCLFLFVWRLGSVRLFDMDEGFYVTCARNMAVSNDWVTPRLNVRPSQRPTETTVPFFEKPILTYWAAASSFRMFGISEWTARIPAAAASLAAVVLVVWTGTRWIGRRAALFAGLAYATAPMVIIDARQMTTDALLTLWFLAAMAGYRERRPFVFAAACALGVLTKGVIGLLLPILVIVVLRAVRAISAGWHGRRTTVARRRPPGQSVRWALALVLFLAMALPWHIAMLRSTERDAMGRTWVQEYIVRQHIDRFKGGDIHHNAPLFTYLGYFLVGFFPWACFTPFAFRYPPRRDALADTCAPAPEDPSTEARRFLLCWFWTVFGFFSLSAAKLPTYIVPAYPAAALLFGRWLDRALKKHSAPEFDRALQIALPADVADSVRTKRELNWGRSAALCTSVLLLAATLVIPLLTASHPVMAGAISDLSVVLCLVLSLGCLAAWLCLRRGGAGDPWKRRGMIGLGVTMVLVVAIATGPGYNLVNRWILSPYQDLAILARSDAEHGAPVVFYAFGDERPSMLMYARDYSPLERKETPLLPFLTRIAMHGAPFADVITIRKTFDSQLRAELSSAHWAVDERARRDSGLDTWLLLRISPPLPAHGTMKRITGMRRHTDG